ncbi:hypothetical protein BDP81DRAFT_433605 [Colletotrichum phormii]|uniref:Uncharacterized protein n=1 Tax=Colletotrichum phormii TaxID=359342 RepID=A0AAI9ZNV2_9PEZI|nr:uncharacterized protein BDP81DRAFT_433605 [Colletotrichum phormii]KAK1634052.1 hypothetical protein BDP81DRAFT_433605 [Colletotrichum phormii]
MGLVYTLISGRFFLSSLRSKSYSIFTRIFCFLLLIRDLSVPTFVTLSYYILGYRVGEWEKGVSLWDIVACTGGWVRGFSCLLFLQFHASRCL